MRPTIGWPICIVAFVICLGLWARPNPTGPIEARTSLLEKAQRETDDSIENVSHNVRALTELVKSQQQVIGAMTTNQAAMWQMMKERK